MHKTLQKNMASLHRGKATLLQELASVKPEQLHNKPAPDVWSPIQIAAHLVIVEQRSCDYIERKINDLQNLKPIGLKEKWNLFLLLAALALPLKFKAPAPVRDVPEAPQLSILVDQWTEVRQRMERALEKLQEHDLQKPIFKHPRSGPTNAIGFLQFLEAHFNHHLPQIHSRLS